MRIGLLLDSPKTVQPWSFSILSLAFFDTSSSSFLSGLFLFGGLPGPLRTSGLVFTSGLGLNSVLGLNFGSTFTSALTSGSRGLGATRLRSSFTFFWIFSEAFRAASRAGRPTLERRLRPEELRDACWNSGVSCKRSRIRF